MQDPRCVPGEMEKQGKTAYGLAHNLGLGKVFLRLSHLPNADTLDEQVEVALSPSSSDQTSLRQREKMVELVWDTTTLANVVIRLWKMSPRFKARRLTPNGLRRTSR